MTYTDCLHCGGQLSLPLSKESGKCFRCRGTSYDQEWNDANPDEAATRKAYSPDAALTLAEGIRRAMRKANPTPARKDGMCDRGCGARLFRAESIAAGRCKNCRDKDKGFDFAFGTSRDTSDLS